MNAKQLCFSGQAQSCWKILNGKKCIQYSENFQGNSVFSGQVQVALKSWTVKKFAIQCIFTWGQWRIQTRRLGGAPKRLHLLNTPILCDNRWVSHKRGYLLWAKKVAILLVELCNLLWIKIALYHNSKKVWSGSKKMGPVFHRLHITENLVGVSKKCLI